MATGASGKAGGLLGLWAYPSSIVPLSYRLHSELAAEHDGANRWGYRRLKCGSIEAVVTKKRLSELQSAADENGKPWEKLPKQNEAAKELLQDEELPADLDWIDREVVRGWAEMGSPGATETAQVHPYHFTTSIAELAQKAGATIRTNAKVTRLVTSKRSVEGVEFLDRTTGEAGKMTDVTDIVVAAGPWTGRVLPRSKVEGLRAHSVVYDVNVSPYAVFTDIELPSDFIPEHRAKMGQKRQHKGRVDPEIYARPFGEAYACGKSFCLFSQQQKQRYDDDKEREACAECCIRRTGQRRAAARHGGSGASRRGLLRRHHLVFRNGQPRAGHGADQGQTGLLPATTHPVRTGEWSAHRPDSHARLVGCRRPYVLGDPKRPGDGKAHVGVHFRRRGEERQCCQFGPEEV